MEKLKNSKFWNIQKFKILKQTIIQNFENAKTKNFGKFNNLKFWKIKNF